MCVRVLYPAVHLQRVLATHARQEQAPAWCWRDLWKVEHHRRDCCAILHNVEKNYGRIVAGDTISAGSSWGILGAIRLLASVPDTPSHRLSAWPDVGGYLGSLSICDGIPRTVQGHSHLRNPVGRPKRLSLGTGHGARWPPRPYALRCSADRSLEPSVGQEPSGCRCCMATGPPGACSAAERLAFPTWSAVQRTSSESVG
jgi:hypothetical protein